MDTELLAAETAKLSRFLFAARHGLMFGGKRDVYTALGYNRTLTYRDYFEKWDRQDIAKRLVEAAPKATWRSHPDVFDDEDPENITPFEQAWKDIARRLRIFQRLERADILAGIGRYGVLMIGLADQPPANEEAVPVASGDDVLYLQPFSEDQAIISALDEDPGSERFGLPTRYDLKIRIPTTTSDRSRNISVHHSRVIHFAEGSLDADAEGQPRLRPVFNLLDDLLKIVGSSAETYWQARRAIHARNDPKAKPLSADDQTKLKDQVDEYMNDLRQFIGTDGVDLNTIAASVADPQGPFEVVMSLISSTSEIPKRILIGSERGQLASDQDERAWANRIDERQQQFAEPLVLRPLIDRFVDLGAIPEPEGGEYEIRWQSLSDPGEREQAETALTWGRAAQSFQAANQIISPEEARERFLGMDANAPEVEEASDTDTVAPPDDEVPQSETA